MLAVACRAEPTRDAGSPLVPVLAGTGWTALLLDDDFTQGNRPTLVFRKNGKIDGSTGCEAYFGSVELSGTAAIRFRDLEVHPTRQCCTPTDQPQRARFLEALQAARQVRVQAGRLLLLDGDNTVRLLFECWDRRTIPYNELNRLVGMELETLTESHADTVGTDMGVLVKYAPPVNDFGLRDGDVILSVNGRRLANREHAIRVISSYAPGETLVLEVLREGVPLSFGITLHSDQGTCKRSAA